MSRRTFSKVVNCELYYLYLMIESDSNCYNKIEMLFVRDTSIGKGIGKKLVANAIDKEGVKYVDVNEDNIAGLGFYKHVGFQVFKKSELDDHGDPFPILHMV